MHEMHEMQTQTAGTAGGALLTTRDVQDLIKVDKSTIYRMADGTGIDSPHSAHHRSPLGR